MSRSNRCVRVRMLTLVIGSVFAVGLSEPAPAQTAKKEARAKILSSTIQPGKGVEDCVLGAGVKEARTRFGKPSSETDTTLQFNEEGVEVGVHEGKIDALYFHYRSRSHESYAGKTERGISKQSSIEDVTNRYGKPERIGESVVSDAGDAPGAKEMYLCYARQGIAFTFHDKRLANVRVFAKAK